MEYINHLAHGEDSEHENNTGNMNGLLWKDGNHQIGSRGENHYKSQFVSTTPVSGSINLKRNSMDDSCMLSLLCATHDANEDTYILHPAHPTAKPSLLPYAGTFGRRFGVVFTCEYGAHHTKGISTLEILSCYPIQLPAH